MKIYQIVNAITMVAPLISWLKNRKRQGGFKKLMQIHIPISMAYHMCASFPHFPIKVLNILRSMDYLCVHLSGVLAGKDIRQTPTSHSTVLINTFILYKCVKDGVDLPMVKCAAIVYENIDIFRINRKKASQAAVVGTCATFFYINDGHIPYGHAIFHVSLYWLYECYFDLLKDV